MTLFLSFAQGELFLPVIYLQNMWTNYLYSAYFWLFVYILVTKICTYWNSFSQSFLPEKYLYSFLAAPGPPLPRPVLPRDRGYMDRVVEYLVGDGPNNRYALICRQCQSHNGMALKEEFEYIGRYFWFPFPELLNFFFRRKFYVK